MNTKKTMTRTIQGKFFITKLNFIFIKNSKKKNDIYHELTDDVQANLEEAILAMKNFSNHFTMQDEFSNFRIVFVKYLENNLLKDFVSKKLNDKQNIDYNSIVETKRHKISDGKREVVRNILRIKRRLNNFIIIVF